MVTKEEDRTHTHTPADQGFGFVSSNSRGVVFSSRIRPHTVDWLCTTTTTTVRCFGSLMHNLERRRMQTVEGKPNSYRGWIPHSPIGNLDRIQCPRNQSKQRYSHWPDLPQTHSRQPKIWSPNEELCRHNTWGGKSLQCWRPSMSALETKQPYICDCCPSMWTIQGKSRRWAVALVAESAVSWVVELVVWSVSSWAQR